MPKRFVRGEDGARARLEGLPYAQVPDTALRLSGVAYKILGRLQRLAGTKASVEVDDQDLGQWIRRSRRSVQRAWSELESAGLVERRRRGGRRRVLLLYTLAGREAAVGKVAHACATRGQKSEVHACARNGTRMGQERHTHGPLLSHPLKREEEEKSKTPGVGGQASEGPPPPPGVGPESGLTPAQWWAAHRPGGSTGTAAGTPTKDPRRPR